MYGHQGNAGTLSHVISINYQKRKFPFISNHVQEPNLYKADGLHSDVKNPELQGFYDSFLIHFKYPYPVLWDLRL